MPATAASAEPRMKVMEMMALASTPIRVATSMFWAVARMALPSFVFLTRQDRPTIMIADEHMIMIWMALMLAPATGSVVDGSRAGKDWYSRPHIIMARFCSRMETPIAVISGARRGAPRRG